MAAIAIKIVTINKNIYIPMPSDIAVGNAKTIVAVTAIINRGNFPFILIPILSI